jgi:hypothetical protein
MDNITLITTALEYYDTNNEIYEKFNKKITYIKFIYAENDLEHNIIIFYDKNKKEIARSKYEIIGLYNSNSNVWIWAWAVPSFKKNSTGIVRKIWNYGAVLDPSVKYLKTELVTARFRVADKIQLDIHISIASYLSKNPMIYKHMTSIISTVDSDGFVDITKTNDNDPHTAFYMFLLDYKNMDKKLYSHENDCE